MQLGRVPIETVTLRTGHGAPVDQCRWQELRAGLYTPHREVLRLLDPGQLTDSLKPELVGPSFGRWRAGCSQCRRVYWQ